MNVLILTTSFPLFPKSISGIFIKRFISHLPDDVTPTILTPDGRMTAPKYVSGCRVITFRYAPKKLQLLAHEPGGLPVALKKNKLLFLLLPIFFSALVLACYREAKHNDLIHANWSICGFAAGLVSLVTKVPVLTTLRGTDVNLIHASFFCRSLVRWSLTLNDLVVTVSEPLARIISQNFPYNSHKIEIVANGVNDSFYSISPRSSSNKKLKLLTAGNLIAGKGVDQIIRALGSMDANLNWHLTILGSGPELENLKLLSQEENLSPQIIFEGQIEPDNVASFMQQSDIFIFASHAEGRPNVILEAMAAGLPIIASDIPTVAELIQDGQNGLLFPVGKIDILSKKIASLLEHPNERLILGAAARSFMLDKNFKWQHTAENYAELYRQILKKKQEQT